MGERCLAYRFSTVTLMLAVTSVMVGACGVKEEADLQLPQGTPAPPYSETPAPAATPTATPVPPHVRPTWPTDVSGLHALLPTPSDMPSGWVLASVPHSVMAPDGPAGPPNARVQYELETESDNPATISCLEFYLVNLEDEAQARTTFRSFAEHLTGPTGIQGQSREALEAPLIGDETAASTLLSTVWEIGGCGNWPVYAYAGLTFRRGSSVAQVIGFASKERPPPAFLWDMARLQLTRIDGGAVK